MNAEVPPEQMLRHLDYLISRLGEDRVGLGSDFDGAIVPKFLKSSADLPKLRKAMIDHDYGDALMIKLWPRKLAARP